MFVVHCIVPGRIITNDYIPVDILVVLFHPKAR